MTHLSPVVVSQVHDLLRCSGALDGHRREGEDGITTMESSHVCKGLLDSVWRVVAGH